jgi:hypothetical protein
MNAAVRMTEDMLQVYTADLLAAFKRPGVIAYHVPNGGKRHPAVAKKLKAFGTLAGVPDWNIIVPAFPTARIAYLELKDAKGVQSSAQKEFQRACDAIGVLYAVARSPAEVDGVLTAIGAINKVSRRVNVVTGRLAGDGREERSSSRHNLSQPAARPGALCGAGTATAERSRPQTQKVRA